jgi:hypothetical protein
MTNLLGYKFIVASGRNAVITFRQANDILSDKTLESKNMLTYDGIIWLLRVSKGKQR